MNSCDFSEYCDCYNNQFIFMCEDEAIRNAKTSLPVKHLTWGEVKIEFLAIKRCSLISLEISWTWTNDVKQCNIDSVPWVR